MTTRSTIRRATLLSAAGCGLLVAATGPASAGAFYLQEQSVKAAGRAFSGEVADTGAESMWWNPAAIGGVASSAYIGATAIRPTGNVTDRGTLIVRPNLTGGAPSPAGVGGDGDIRDPINNGVLPAGGVAVKMGKLAFGVAITSPFSFTTNYPADSWTRYEADKTRLRTIDIQPTIAFAPAPGISVGAALNIEHAKATLSNALPNLVATLPDGEQTLQGHGWDLGWSVGAQGRLLSVLTVGASYKSSVKHDLSGTVTVDGLLGPLATNNFSANTHASFRTPWQAIVGARLKVIPTIAINTQIVRLGWNKFDAIDLGAPIQQSVPEDYRNTWSLAAGIDYDVLPVLTLRAGVQHDQTPTRNGERDARVPDSNRMNYAFGATAHVFGVALDAAVSYIDFKNASIDRQDAAFYGTAVQTPILVDGELHKAHAWTFGLGGRVSF